MPGLPRVVGGAPHVKPVTAYRPGKMAMVRKERDAERLWRSFIALGTMPRPPLRTAAPIIYLPPEYAWMADEPEWNWWPWIFVAIAIVGVVLGALFFHWVNFL